jgi:DNA polymerase III alpha subunit
MEKKTKTPLLLLLDKFEFYKKAFFKKVEEEGFDKSVSDQWWNIIASQADYSFAKSHSLPYSKLTYLTMYLKAKYPKAFFLALLNNTARAKKDKEGASQIVRIIFHAKNDYNINILPPDINKSQILFSKEENKIRFGLQLIKDVGESSEDIIKNQPYSSFENFLEKHKKGSNVTKRSILALIYSGAFDVLEKNRGKLLDYYENLKNKKGKEQTSFIDFSSLKKESENKKHDELFFIKKEIDYLNMTFTEINTDSNFPILSTACNGQEMIKFSAFVEDCKEKISKKGKPYFYVRFTDFNKSLNSMAFGEARDEIENKDMKKGMLAKVVATRAGENDGMYFIDKIYIQKSI